MIEKEKIYEVTYPFYRKKVQLLDIDDGSYYDTITWCPGTYGEHVYPDDCKDVCNGEGKMLLHVVDVHKPGKYPERVFYVRSWQDPEGKYFGKSCLRITTTQAFRRLIAGFKYEYEIVPIDGDDFVEG